MDDDKTMVVFMVFLVAVGVLGLAYYQNQDVIHGAALSASNIQLSVMTHLPNGIPLVPDGQTVRSVLRQNKQLNPEDYTPAMIVRQFQFAGRFYRWPVILLLLGTAGWIMIRWEVGFWYRRDFSKNALADYLSGVYRRMKPAVRQDLMNTPIESGENRQRPSPLQVAAREGFLYPEEQCEESYETEVFLDENGQERAHPVDPDRNYRKLQSTKKFHRDPEEIDSYFQQQFRYPFPTEFDGLPWYLKGVFASLMDHAWGERERARDLMDYMSDGYDPDDKTVPYDFADDYLNYYWNHRGMRRIRSLHGSWVRVALVELIDQARQIGTIPATEFHWMKWMDRTTWYVINDAGRRGASMESAGIYAHYEAEEYLDERLAAPTKEVVAARMGLESRLYEYLSDRMDRDIESDGPSSVKWDNPMEPTEVNTETPDEKTGGGMRTPS